MIRLIICYVWAVIVMVFSIPRHLYYKHLIKKDPMNGWRTATKAVNRFFKDLLFIAGTKVTVIGQENIPENTACLFVGNHRSWFDVIILQTLAKNPIGYISKKEFAHTPLLSMYMRDIGTLYIDRENPREALKTIKEGGERMKKGLSLSLFPEGTRNHKDTLLPFKEGGYKMAEKSNSPIILVANSGTDDIWEKNKHFAVKKRHVIIEFMEPVYPSELPVHERKAFYADIPNRINEQLQKNNKNL